MLELEIVSERTNTVLREIFEGKTINYNFDYSNTEAPNAVNFSVDQEIEGVVQQRINGNYFPQSNQLQVNTTSYQPGDGALIDHIYSICTQIVTQYSPSV